ncbi:MAG: SCP2 sterol-binding domain-containing protein [Archaeoglobaceae archaeon]|nr:SCP2 sterol-binding domain-containing protein [Archaeoglobaceae archaeon]MDW8117819.1 SCP2 sterol-binding domain-containing protein [Archaeoglobaceae archaeon]
MVEVVYPKEGLANLLGNLIMQNVRRDKRKAEIAMKTRGTAVIEIRDLGFTATIEFMGDKIEVKNGKPEKSKYALISANYGVISSLLGNSSTIKTLKLMLSGKLKVKNVALAKRLSTIMSTR